MNMKEEKINDSLMTAMLAYLDNRLTSAQADELAQWLGENAENRHYFIEIARLWYASGLLKKETRDTDKAWQKLADRISSNGSRSIKEKIIMFPARYLFRAASILVLMSLATAGFLVFRNNKASLHGKLFEASAPIGSRSTIVFPDGSKVWLNSGTKVLYRPDFGKKNRELYLEGEAYFSVTSNVKMPFRVNTRDISITALGTAFNVKAYNDENIVETTLEKGEVVVERIEKAGNNSGSVPVYLKPNQKAVYVKSSRDLSLNENQPSVPSVSTVPAVNAPAAVIKIDSLVDTRLTTSWKDSKWIFKSEKLRELAPILERRYDISIVFRDSVLCNYKFTGTIKEESLEQVLNVLTIAAPIKYEVSHNQVFFYVDQNQKDKFLKRE